MTEPKHYDNSKVHYINFVTIDPTIHTDLTLLKVMRCRKKTLEDLEKDKVSYLYIKEQSTNQN
jgi:hypothetical protein